MVRETSVEVSFFYSPSVCIFVDFPIDIRVFIKYKMCYFVFDVFPWISGGFAMLKNVAVVAKTDSVEGTLAKLHDSPFVFYLTGSRFFTPNESLQSDYDFFVQSRPKCSTQFLILEEFLGSLGFIPLSNSEMTLDYANVQGVTIIYRKYFRNQVPPYIDVQIVEDAEQKELAQNIIKEILPMLRHISKPKMKNVWNAVFRGLNQK